MDTRDKQYRKIAKNKAKEYIKIRKGYKTRQEKKAFNIAETIRIREWKNSILSLDNTERSAQMKAFRYYRFRVNFIRNIILIGVLVLSATIMLIVFL